MSVYQDALGVIRKHPGTSGAGGLAMLVMSLWNEECGFSIRECLRGLDAPNTDLALRMVAQFARDGETAELVEVGHAVNKLYPRLWTQSMAAVEARREVLRGWERDDDERRKAEYGED